MYLANVILFDLPLPSFHDASNSNCKRYKSTSTYIEKQHFSKNSNISISGTDGKNYGNKSSIQENCSWIVLESFQVH